MSLEEAENLLRQSTVSKSSLLKFKVGILKTLCDKHSYAVATSGKREKPIKSDYVTAIILKNTDHGEHSAALCAISRQSEEPKSFELSAHTTKTALQKLQIPVLKELCMLHSLNVDVSGRRGRSIKSDFVAALVVYCKSLIDETEDIDSDIASPITDQTVSARLYENAKDWQHVLQIECRCLSNGNIDIVEVGQLLRPGTSMRCRVIDQRNFKPYHEYKPGFILADDIDMLKRDGHLRLVFYSH